MKDTRYDDVVSFLWGVTNNSQASYRDKFDALTLLLQLGELKPRPTKK